MAAPTKKIFSVGLNAARVYALTTAGYPAATNATVYSGINIGGPIEFSIETPQPTNIAHPGNNQILQYDVLPSIDAAVGTLKVSRQDNDTVVLLTNTKNATLGDTNVMGWMTNQQGTEPTVALVTYQQAKDNSGNRIWHTYLMPRAIILPAVHGMSRDRQDINFAVQPQVCTKNLTGLSFDSSTYGYTSTRMLDLQSSHRLHFSAWKTTATEAIYTLDTAFPAYITGGVGMVVYKNGVLMTNGAVANNTNYLATTTTITFGAALTNGDMVVTMYEVDDTAVVID